MVTAARWCDKYIFSEWERDMIFRWLPHCAAKRKCFFFYRKRRKSFLLSGPDVTEWISLISAESRPDKPVYDSDSLAEKLNLKFCFCSRLFDVTK